MLHFNLNFIFGFVLFQRGDAVNAPSPFKERSTSLEQAFGLYEAAFCATAQLFPDVDDSVGAALSPSDGSVNVFEKQDSTTQMDCAASAPPLKRSRRSPRTPPELAGPHRQLCQPSNQTFPQETHVQSEQTQKGERSSSEEHSILPQHHNSALCVC